MPPDVGERGARIMLVMQDDSNCCAAVFFQGRRDGNVFGVKLSCSLQFFWVKMQGEEAGKGRIGA